MPQIYNASTQKQIQIAFAATGGSATGENIDIPPQQTIKIEVSSGTMALYVWLEKKLIWSGVVPVSTRKPLVVYPESNTVAYDGTALPNNLQTSKWSGWWKVLLILLIFFVLIIVLIKSGLWRKLTSPH